MKKRQQHTATFTHEDEATGEEWNVKIDFTVDPGEPEVRNLRNGDPGYPGSPPEIDDHSYTVGSWAKYDENGELLQSYERRTDSTDGRNRAEIFNARFRTKVDADPKLAEKIDAACWASLESGGDDPDDSDRGGY